MKTKSHDLETVMVTIIGRVQGVFFRACTRDEAVSRQLTGYVKNCPDGSVQALFQGDKTAVGDMLLWCRQGSPASRVDRVTVNPMAFEPGYQDFQIHY